MKRSVLVKYALMFGIASGSAAYGQVFNVHDIQQGYNFYGYNIMAFGQGVVSDPGNNIWNGFGDGGPNNAGDTFGGGRLNDALLHNNPGNPYAWAHDGLFANGNVLFSPQNLSVLGGNCTSAGVLTSIQVPSMNYGFDTAIILTNASQGTIADVSYYRQQVAEWVFAVAAVVNGTSPGAGTAANPLGTMTLSNVPPGNYSLYLFGANPDGTRGATFTSSSGTPSNGVTVAMNPYNGSGGSTGQGTPNVGPLTNFVFGEDYVVFNNVKPAANGVIQITWAPVDNTNSTLSGEGDFNGLQLAVAPPVAAPPYINTEPAGSTNDQNTSEGLSSVGVSGYPAVAYQWYSGNPPGIAVPGQTSNTLAFASAQTGQSGNYFVVATNIYGAVTSSVADVTIAAAPLIVSQSSTNGLLLYSGNNAFTLSVGAYGATPLYYYWQANGVTVAVTTNLASYQFVNVTASANYTCLVSNYVSTATSLPLPVTIVSPPATPYVSALLSLKPFVYWPLTESDPNGTTAYDYIRGNNGTYVGTFTPGVPGPAAGFGANSYAFGVSLGQGYIDVPAGTANALNFTGPMTMITWIQGDGSLPPDFTTIAGKGDHSYREDVDGNGLAHFADPGPDAQGRPIVSESSWHMIVGVYTGTNESLYVDGALADREVTTGTPGDTLDFWIGGAPDYPGSRNFYGSIAHVALFTNVLSAAQVQALFTAGETPPFIALALTNVLGYVGGSASFVVEATGYQPISYQWYGPGGIISGATNGTLVISNLNQTGSPANSGPGTYYCVITNEFGSTNTPEDGTVALSVSSSAPFFSPDLSSVIYGIIGSPLILSPGEAGNEPITNQWFYGASSPPTTALHNGGRISGANSSALVINNAQLSDAGYYQLAATNNIAPYSASSAAGQVIMESEPAFNNGAGWTINGNASFNNNVLAVTTGQAGEANSIFFDSPVYIGAFALSFTYQATPGTTTTLADGITFCMQNSPAGLNAVGGGGGSIGYQGIPDSAAICIDLFNIAPGGYQFITGGLNPSSSGNYVTLAPSVSLAATNPVDVNIVYTGNAMSLTFHDTVAHGTYSTNIFVGAIPSYVGGTTAYIGFTGGTGSDDSTQTISNFSYVPLAGLTALVSGTNLVLSWPVGVGGYVLEKTTSLHPVSWSTISGPYNIVGQNYQVVVPASSPTAFYRLAVTP